MSAKTFIPFPTPPLVGLILRHPIGGAVDADMPRESSSCNPPPGISEQRREDAMNGLHYTPSTLLAWLCVIIYGSNKRYCAYGNQGYGRYPFLHYSLANSVYIPNTYVITSLKPENSVLRSSLLVLYPMSRFGDVMACFNMQGAWLVFKNAS